MKIISVLFIFFLPVVCFSQLPVIASKKYSWVTPIAEDQKTIMTSIIFEGSAHDMAFLQMSANAITSNKKSSLQVPDNEEHLILVKSGIIEIGIRDRKWSVSGGSIALLMPGEKYNVQNAGKDSCAFYLMKYRSSHL